MRVFAVLALFLLAPNIAASSPARKATRASTLSSGTHLTISANLQELIRIEKQNNTKLLADRFAEPLPNKQFVGQPFRAEVHVESLAEGSFSAQYESGVTTFEVTPTTGDISFIIARLPSVIDFPMRLSVIGSHVGRTAYGANVSVTDSRAIIDGLMLVDQPSGGGDLSVGKRYVAKISVSGEAARHLFHGARFVLEGTIREPSDHKLVHCADDAKSATISSPSTAIFEKCYVGVTLRRLALLDADARVPKEWSMQGLEQWSRITN